MNAYLSCTPERFHPVDRIEAWSFTQKCSLDSTALL